MTPAPWCRARSSSRGAVRRRTARRTSPTRMQRGAAAILTDDVTASPPEDQRGAPDNGGSCRAASASSRSAGTADPSRSRLRVIGVTGNERQDHRRHPASRSFSMRATDVHCGLLGTVDIDDGTTIAPAALTTPGAPELAALMARMVANGCCAVGHGGEFACPRTAARRGACTFSRRRVHESEWRSSRLPRHDGGVRGGEGAALLGTHSADGRFADPQR